MIKINLLPSSIYEKKVVRQLMIFFAVLILATAAAGVTMKIKLDASTAYWNQEANRVETEKKRIDGINSQASAERSKIAPIKAKLDYIKAVETYNVVMPALYQELAKYTYKGILYRKVSPSSTALQIEAYTPSLSDLGRYVLNMYKAESLFSSVSISAIPGYPEAEGVSVMNNAGVPSGSVAYPGMNPSAVRYGGLEAVASGVSRTIKEKGFNFSVVCNLVTPIAAPAGPAGGAPTDPNAAAMGVPAPAPAPAPAPGPEPGAGGGGDEMGGMRGGPE